MKKVILAVLTLLIIPASASAQWINRGTGSNLGSQPFDLEYCDYRLSLAGCDISTTQKVTPTTVDLSTKSSALIKAQFSPLNIFFPGVEVAVFDGGNSSVSDYSRLKNGISCGWFSSVSSETLTSSITAQTQILNFSLLAVRNNVRSAQPFSFKGAASIRIRSADGNISTLKVDTEKIHLFERCN